MKYLIKERNQYAREFLYELTGFLWKTSCISVLVLLLFCVIEQDLPFIRSFSRIDKFAVSIILNLFGNLVFFIGGALILFFKAKGYVFPLTIYVISYLIYSAVLFIPTFLILHFLYQVITYTDKF